MVPVKGCRDPDDDRSRTIASRVRTLGAAATAPHQLNTPIDLIRVNVCIMIA